MGRKRLLVKRSDNPCSRQIMYSKRREGILKKAIELSMLYDTDVGLLMFSPTGRLTSYAHKGRIEDIFLRYIDQPDDFKGPVDNEEVLESKLCELNKKKYEAQDKMRSYNLDMTKILSIAEADMHEQFVIDAIRRIELKKANLLEKETSLSKPNDVEMPAVETDCDLTTDESVSSKRKRNQSADECKKEARLPIGPHLSISYLKTQKNWNLENVEEITSSEGEMSHKA
ncbi:hypothetical protein DITRI_Ditri08aG0069800 [Diplodiscus trichospermus]